MNSTLPHNFHIPVMGTGFTIDTPVKVAPYGISSAISLVDDMLMEKMREFYCNKLDIPFQEITNKIDDFRAKRITAFLDLVDKMVKEKFEILKTSAINKSHELEKYIEMLPDFSAIKKGFNEFIDKNKPTEDIIQWLHNNLKPGSIDVNIMTKLDKVNYKKNEPLPSEFNDAHAALRGFANSKLTSSVVLSAGMNPRLYSYFETFEDFYPDAQGNFIKKIVLKVSDYRSALIQGKFLAKKGIWISEYRIESGLNCGGHAFATDGFLMGPILAEFKENRSDLTENIFEILKSALEAKGKTVPEKAPTILITAQGGVGSAAEHDFLLDEYDLDSVGWGTPFLLVPEATNVDNETKALLSAAKEEDLYLSDISPLGVPFNTLRGNTKDVEKLENIAAGKPGSSCPKKYLVSNKEYSDKAICTASSKYQKQKIEDLNVQELQAEDHQKALDKIVVKSCICVGLGTAPMLNNDINTKLDGTGVSICPGPNMAYFSKIVSLKNMVDHIYGRSNIITRTDRPNMFMKELGMYIDYLNKKIDELGFPTEAKQQKYIDKFHENLKQGIEYYSKVFSSAKSKFDVVLSDAMKELNELEKRLGSLFQQI